MIQEKNLVSVERSGDFQAVSFGIKGTEGMAQVFGVLRNCLFSNKILAVVRETVSNSIDANIEDGKAAEPVRVHLPDFDDLTFKVRDFGNGLSDEDVKETLCNYGCST